MLHIPHIGIKRGQRTFAASWRHGVDSDVETVRVRVVHGLRRIVGKGDFALNTHDLHPQSIYS